MNLFYREEGKGTPVVILHGLYGSSDNWVTIARKLAERYRVISVDHRNHGASPHTSEHTYEAMLTDLAWLFHETGIEKAHLIGHSMGGKVAMAFAADYPEHTLSLTVADIAPVNYLANPASAIQYQFHKRLLDTLYSIDLSAINERSTVETELAKGIPEEHVSRFILKNLYRNKVGKFQWKINVPILRQQLHHIISGVDFHEFSDRLPILSYPVLFIKGELSGYISDEAIEDIHTVYPESRIVTLPETTHFLHAEKPDEFAEIVFGFLNHIG
jgi:esterase